ncbi:sensor histidine kinase [Loktanella sp. Alg231-35]|uniref:sensor histidine kinase n=1 Tax=Loktanella sp. Alg231-35 TaxID=1922220 RepID=UPI000D55F324|nr:sensor histidine kinase [Loktanella sp. Alg231-35]
MRNSLSLRGRLTLIILLPLILVATLVGVWAYFDAQTNAAERFDRSLLSTALAISRDTAVTGGDALSEETRDLLRDTSGGAVFYHVYAPDGVFVTGYATPPVPPSPIVPETSQTYFDAFYQGAPVRALRFSQTTTIDGISGPFTFSVWQKISVRDGFVATRTGPVFLIIAALIGALAIIVWFGVARGLAPLIELEDAIARRSASDLSPIKRRIPQEVTGIVGRFNKLLDDLSRTLDAKNAFISDAAHQLRNPIAGVLTLAESVANAKTLADKDERSADLLDAARSAGQLANNLLTLERAQANVPDQNMARFDPLILLHHIAKKSAAVASERGIAFQANIEERVLHLTGDPVMFEQAILNIITNALDHGGPQLSRIDMTAKAKGDSLVVTVWDDGKGIPERDFDRALGRFSQIGPSAGSGLGLPIATAVAKSFEGTVKLRNEKGKFEVVFSCPLKAAISA